MSDLYTYVMQHDAGLAPNPFWGTCTLAVCTPNHQGSRAKGGDWIAGVSDKRRGYKLIYVMEVDQRVHMNDYFIDERFIAKRPILDGTAQQRCGDNFYSFNAGGHWTQHPNRYHTGSECLAQDTRNPWVFVARDFWYLSIHPRLIVSTAEAAIDAAIAGLGITCVLSYQIESALRRGALRLLLESFEPPPLPVSFLYSSQGRLPLKLRALLDFAAPRLRTRVQEAQAALGDSYRSSSGVE